MNRRLSALALTLVVLSATTVLALSPKASGGEAVGPAPAAASPDAPTAPAVDRSRLAPMHRDIQAVVAEETARVEELNLRFLAATVPADMLAIQKEIEAVKKGGMIAVFEIQLRYAEAEGRTDTAGELRTTIEAIRNPKRPERIGG